VRPESNFRWPNYTGKLNAIMRSVLFVSQGAGDVIMHLPLLRAVVVENDDAALFVIRSEDIRPIIELMLGADPRFSCVAVRRDGESRFASALRVLRAVRRHRPDASAQALDVHPWLGAAFAFLSGARLRVGPAAPFVRFFFNRHLELRDPTVSGVHNVESACRTAELLGRRGEASIRLSDRDGRIESEFAPEFPCDHPGPVLGIAFGSGLVESHKRPSLEACRQIVIDLCRELPDARLVLLGDSGESEMNASMAALPEFRGVNLTGSTRDPRMLLATLRRCTLLVSACNGISHFAALAGCPVVGLFGPTNPYVTGPFGIPREIVSRRLECSPCYRRGYIRGCGNPVCMDIDARPVIDATRRLLQPRSSSASVSG